MIDRLTQLLQRPYPPVLGSASLSITSALFAWMERTLPVLQWVAALVAVLSGIVALALGLRQVVFKLREDFGRGKQ